MTAKREHDMAAAPVRCGSNLRASHADREHVLEVLKAAFVQGRLNKDELDMRVSQTLVSRTYADLAVITADIPYGPIRAQPARKPALTRPAHPENKVVNAFACATLALLVLAAPVLTGNFELFFVLLAALMGALFVAAGHMVYSAHKRHASRQQR